MEKTPRGIHVTVTTTNGPNDPTWQTEYINVPQGVWGTRKNTREMDTRHGTK